MRKAEKSHEKKEIKLTRTLTCENHKKIHRKKRSILDLRERKIEK